jgi:hypothetical protein
MKKTLISLAAAATLAIGLSATAKADPGFGFGFGIGPHGHPHFGVSIYDPGYAPGYYDAGYGDGGDCGFEWVSGWHRVHHHMVYGPHKVWTCGGDY